MVRVAQEGAGSIEPREVEFGPQVALNDGIVDLEFRAEPVLVP
jgi:hypothetical protein